MNLTARQLNRATLGRQLLLRREPLDVVGEGTGDPDDATLAPEVATDQP